MTVLPNCLNNIIWHREGNMAILTKSRLIVSSCNNDGSSTSLSSLLSFHRIIFHNSAFVIFFFNIVGFNYKRKWLVINEV